MKRLRTKKRVSRDEAALRAWEDMRSEVLHEVQDGGTVLDEQIEAAGDVAALETPWSLSRPLHPRLAPMPAEQTRAR